MRAGGMDWSGSEHGQWRVLVTTVKWANRLHDMRKNFWVTSELLASQKGFCFMGLVLELIKYSCFSLSHTWSPMHWLMSQLTLAACPFKARWLIYIPPSLTFKNSTFCPHSVFMCFVWIWEETAIISLYSINRLVFITETESVYCAVRAGSLYIIQAMCFVWIWEQTAIISLYSINSLDL
jgi:hypothetical protein